MLSRKFPLPVKFICGIIYSQEKIYARAKQTLENKFGEIDFESEIIDFNYTHYYEKEMGRPLFRRFISFKKLQDPGNFIAIKLFCIKVEKKFSINGNRTINMDPGYLNEAKLILTTTKDFSHRIYLGKGIYAEVTLYYKQGDFQDLATTYPDYRALQHKRFFLSLREAYRNQIKNVSKR